MNGAPKLSATRGAPLPSPPSPLKVTVGPPRHAPLPAEANQALRREVAALERPLRETAAEYGRHLRDPAKRRALESALRKDAEAYKSKVLSLAKDELARAAANK